MEGSKETASEPNGWDAAGRGPAGAMVSRWLGGPTRPAREGSIPSGRTNLFESFSKSRDRASVPSPHCPSQAVNFRVAGVFAWQSAWQILIRSSQTESGSCLNPRRGQDVESPRPSNPRAAVGLFQTETWP